MDKVELRGGGINVPAQQPIEKHEATLRKKDGKRDATLG
jgi:hypothetical protein